MTSVVYLRCNNKTGIMCSDGQGTNSNGSYSIIEDKVYVLDKVPALVGFTGSVGYNREIINIINAKLTAEVDYSELKKVLLKSYEKVKSNEFKRWSKQKIKEGTKKSKSKLRASFEKDDEFNYEMLGCGFDYNGNVNCFFYDNGNFREGDRDFAIGCGYNESLFKIEKKLREYTRDDSKKIKKSKGVRICLESLRIAESDHVGGEPQIAILEKDKPILLTSKEAYVLDRSLLLEDIEVLDRKFVDSVFDAVIEDREDIDKVIDLIKSKIPVEKAYELLLTRPL